MDNYRLSEADIREFSKKSIRVLTIPFDLVEKEGDSYVFVKNGKVFSIVERECLTPTQINFFDSIGDSAQ